MNIYEELRSLSRISKTFRKKRGPRARWPAEFQLRVLQLIDFGFSPQALSKKLCIPVQTYYHWRRMWKNRPTLGPNFIEVPVSGKLKGSSEEEKREVPSDLERPGMTLIDQNGLRIENVSEEFCLRILKNAV